MNSQNLQNIVPLSKLSHQKIDRYLAIDPTIVSTNTQLGIDCQQELAWVSW